MEKSHSTKWDLTCVEVRSHLGGMSTPPCWKTSQGKIKALGNATVYDTSITACKSNVNLINKKLEKKTQTAKNSYKLPPNDFFTWRKNNVLLPRYIDFCIFVKSTTFKICDVIIDIAGSNIVLYGKFISDSPIIFFYLVCKLLKGLFQPLCQSVNCMSWVFES